MIDEILRLSFVVLARMILWIRPALPVICCLLLWTTIAFTLWSFFKNIRQGVANIKQLHRIPCADCAYATGSHLLKCSIQPCLAFSEDAIDCPDFEPASFKRTDSARVNGLSAM
ncbi:MAG: hypothetical protein WBG63_20725 [Phormidesmis sp.]